MTGNVLICGRLIGSEQCEGADVSRRWWGVANGC